MSLKDIIGNFKPQGLPSTLSGMNLNTDLKGVVIQPTIPEKLDNIENTIERYNQAIVRMGESSTELSTAGVNSARETERLTRKIHTLTWIMAICAAASVIVSIISLIIALQPR